MSLKRLSSNCSQCKYKDTCDHKMMEAVGILEPAAQTILESADAPVMVEHNYRQVKVSEGMTITIDLEDIKKRLVDNFYKSNSLLMYGG